MATLFALVVALFMPTQPTPSVNWHYNDETHTLRVFGQVNEDMANVIDYFASDMDVLVIQSRGGHFHSAIAIVDTLSSETVEIHVDKHCKSACVLIFASGKERVASPSSIISVHYAWVPALDQFMSPYFAIKMDTSKAYFAKINEMTGVALFEEYNQVMLDAGLVTENMISKSEFIVQSTYDIEFPDASFWNLDIDAMYARGLITSLQ